MRSSCERGASPGIAPYCGHPGLRWVPQPALRVGVHGGPRGYRDSSRHLLRLRGRSLPYPQPLDTSVEAAGTSAYATGWNGKRGAGFSLPCRGECWLRSTHQISSAAGGASFSLRRALARLPYPAQRPEGRPKSAAKLKLAPHGPAPRSRPTISAHDLSTIGSGFPMQN